MVKICPTCGGTQVGCPTCGLPAKRKLLKEVIPIKYGSRTWEVLGIDISSWNGNMNFAITKTKCQFVIIRAGYGMGWEDAKLNTYYAGARAQDMPVGLYWYCRPGEDAILTADGFIEVISAHPPQLEIHGDFEQTALNQNDTLNWINTFEDRIKSRLSKLQVAYSNANFWNNKVARSSKWATRVDWVANWTNADYPTMPYDWTFQLGDYWQYDADNNGKAAEYGSTGGDPDMDLDRCNLSVTQFNSKYGTHILPLGQVNPPIPPTPPPTPGTLPEYVIITTGELAIHSTPQAIQTNIVGHALLNTKWYPLEELTANGVVWYRVGKNLFISKNYTRLP